MDMLMGSVDSLSLMGYALRSIMIGILVFLVSRFFPRRSGGQYAAYDFTFFWLVGGMIASPVIYPKIPVLHMVVAVGTVFVWHFIYSLGVVKSRKMARWLIGRPAILIENGRILPSVMRRNLISMEVLLAKLRFQDAEDLNQIAYAILETNGQISVLLKAEAQIATPHELHRQVPSFRMPIVLVHEGIVNDKNLKRLHWDRARLVEELRKRGVADLKQVFYASCDGMGNLYYSMKGC